MSAAQDAWVSILGFRMGDWAGCGAQGGCRGCVWGGGEDEVCIHCMLCDFGCV